MKLLQVPLELRPRIHQAGVATLGQTARETYLLPHLWCLHVYQYNADLWVDGEHLNIRPGSISLLPPGAYLEYAYRGLSRHVYTHFRFPESDSTTYPFQMMTDEPKVTPRILEGMYEVVRRVPVRPIRAEILLWECLWELESVQSCREASAPSLHPVFMQAREQIELGLGEPLLVGELAHELGISHNHLTRVFRKETGKTVADYIQSRRAKRAEHLLKDTSLPMKSIGVQVGYPDPHHFNKFIHRAFGSSPSAVRNAM